MNTFTAHPVSLRFKLLLMLLLWVGYGNAQTIFIENKGQWDAGVKYKAEIPGGWLFVENNRLTYLLIDSKALEKKHFNSTFEGPVQMHSYRVTFDGASLTPAFKTDFERKEYYNYIIGNDPSKWASGAKGFEKITLQEIYPDIDLELYGTDNTSIKYNLVLKRGANPKNIKMRYEGLDGMNLKSGQLILNTAVGDITEQVPVCYQMQDTSVTYIQTDYSLNNNILTFDIKEKYNKRKPFIIDPRVVFSTYSGSTADNWGFTATYDKYGNAYGGGTVYSYLGGRYPATMGAFQTFFQGGVTNENEDLARDAAVYKISPDGKDRLYATYLGGRDNEQPHSMVVNSSNQLIVFGATASDNFPVSGFDNTFGGVWDVFIFTLSEDGKTMIASTYIGGSQRDGLNGEEVSGVGQDYNNISPIAYNYGDMYRGEVMVDNSDNVYIASCTHSSTADGFPASGSAKQSTFGGVQDGFIAKLSPNLGSLLACTYIGGVDYDAAYGIDIDNANGRVFVCGGTVGGLGGAEWANLLSAGAQPALAGGTSDGFLMAFDLNFNALAATYLGTSDYDQCYFVKSDKYGNPYTTGQTAGNWTSSSNIFTQPSGGQFITKFTPDLKQITRSMVYGDGAKPQISPSAFLVDECERIFVSGWGGDVNASNTGPGHGGGTKKMKVTPDAYNLNTDGSDFYLAVFSKNLDELAYATFIGGVTGPNEFGAEHVDGGTSRFDRKGIVYQSVCAGCGGSSKFPVEPKGGPVVSTTNKSQNCNNAVFKLDFENLNRAPVLNDAVFTVKVGDTLNFTYTGIDLDKYDTLHYLVNTAVFDNASFPLPRPVINYPTTGFQKMDLTFSWTPGCQHYTGDTIILKTYMRDVGCPDSKSDSAIIKIFVQEPPVIAPPEVLCLVPETNSSVKLRWEKVDTSLSYFSHMVLVRKDPSGITKNLAIFKRGDSLSFVDKTAANYKNVNYCYFIYVVNTCNKRGPDSYIICSKDQFDSPIKNTEMVTATVVDNEAVKLIWKRSTEDDFDSYQIYRGNRVATGPHDAGFQYYDVIKGLNDTSFTDYNIKVASQAMCYKIVVTDKCGHISQPSNPGCNIIIRGVSKPFEHNLDWDDYSKWGNGTDNFDLWRKDDRQQWDIVTNTTAGVRTYVDDKLDYDWGGYWYKVVAHEDGGNGAESQSNEVYLVQKPLLHVPTGFTPTGDNLNETWGIVDVFVREYHMQVFNRWGQKVFETTDKNEDWKGEFLRRTPADNVFIWQVRYTGWDNSIHHQTGTVTILN